MTLDRDELRVLIREVIEERDAERMAHPERRERMTSFTGHDGVTLHSVTQSRRDWIKTIAAVIGATSIIVSAFLGFVIYPMMDSRAQRAIEQHTIQAQKKMDEIAKQIVFRPEWERWTATSDERFKNQSQINQELRDALKEMNGDIKELLRRVR